MPYRVLRCCLMSVLVLHLNVRGVTAEISTPTTVPEAESGLSTIAGNERIMETVLRRLHALPERGEDPFHRSDTRALLDELLVAGLSVAELQLDNLRDRVSGAFIDEFLQGELRPQRWHGYLRRADQCGIAREAIIAQLPQRHIPVQALLASAADKEEESGKHERALLALPLRAEEVETLIAEYEAEPAAESPEETIRLHAARRRVILNVFTWDESERVKGFLHAKLLAAEDCAEARAIVEALVYFGNTLEVDQLMEIAEVSTCPCERLHLLYNARHPKVQHTCLQLATELLESGNPEHRTCAYKALRRLPMDLEPWRLLLAAVSAEQDHRARAELYTSLASYASRAEVARLILDLLRSADTNREIKIEMANSLLRSSAIHPGVIESEDMHHLVDGLGALAQELRDADAELADLLHMAAMAYKRRGEIVSRLPDPLFRREADARIQHDLAHLMLLSKRVDLMKARGTFSGTAAMEVQADLERMRNAVEKAEQRNLLSELNTREFWQKWHDLASQVDEVGEKGTD